MIRSLSQSVLVGAVFQSPAVVSAHGRVRTRMVIENGSGALDVKFSPGYHSVSTVQGGRN